MPARLNANQPPGPVPGRYQFGGLRHRHHQNIAVPSEGANSRCKSMKQSRAAPIRFQAPREEKDGEEALLARGSLRHALPTDLLTHVSRETTGTAGLSASSA